MLSQTPYSYLQACYFSLLPRSYDHYSTETPTGSPLLSPQETSTDPTHPLLACRHPQPLSVPSSPTLSSNSTFLQMQTVAAHGHSIRPRPVPIQNVLHVTSDDSTSSDESITSNDSRSSFELARCSRCQRTPSIDSKTGKNNMVQYGLNLWYCNRCASLVGLVNR